MALRRQNPWVLPTSAQMGYDLAVFDPPPWGFDVPCLGFIVRASGCLRHLRPVGGGLGACWLPAVLPVRVSLVPGRLGVRCPAPGPVGVPARRVSPLPSGLCRVVVGRVVGLR